MDQDSANNHDLSLDFLNILEYAILKRLDAMDYEIHGALPSFYNKLFPKDQAAQVCLNPWAHSSMLEYFLLDAEEFFESKPKVGSKVNSGIWLEMYQETGEEFPLIAKAWQLPHDQILTIQVIHEEYEERIRILRKARMELLERRKISDALTSFKKKALYDSMTQLYNKGTFLEILQHQIDKFHTYSPTLALFIIDVDHFKQVNDTMGHLVGDSVLMAVADILKNSLRKNDAPARYGGDEFAIVAPGTNMDQSLKLAEKLRERIQEHDFGTGNISVTISVGCTIYRAGETAQNFIHRADLALYEAKQQGRNRVSLRDPWLIDDEEVNSTPQEKA